MSIEKLISKQIPGSQTTKRNHIRRGEKIAQMIQERFQIYSPYQWQLKHLKWIMGVLKSEVGEPTLYDYWLTIRAISSCLGKWENWQNQVPNPKYIFGKSTGRKPMLSNKNS